MSVSLPQLLAARDDRAVQYRQWLATCPSVSLVVLSLVIPGAIKDKPNYRQLLQVGKQTCQLLFSQNLWSIRRQETFMSETGLYSLWLVAHPAAHIKAQTILAEQSHPLGRLWDIDVLDQSARPMSRQQLGYPQRRCFMCQHSAHECARSRRHSLEQIHRHIEELLDGWFTPH
ncbi:citrate lyase holo-[acyl-carrier protein] synthase [Celerinatantimonas yamalensis]|uniref:citrate lyase holo-[acyl-carrier protein] synthase n=1 Tax=Celerinatantimonas yamalensis TaxID=559956 RepID=A0ABW9GAT0_9GAMM